MTETVAMTGTELRAALISLGMTPKQFADARGYSERQVRRWFEAGSVVPRWVKVSVGEMMSATGQAPTGLP